MKDISIPSKYPKHLEALFEKLDPPKERLIIAIDATASRQPTWDMASKLMSQMFQAAVGSGGIEVQLLYYRGANEYTASRWMTTGAALSRIMSSIMCRSGLTQIGRVLAHIGKENARQKVAAAVVISDAFEEVPDKIYAAARKLNSIPIFMFQEGDDKEVAGVYSKIARITGGALGRFDSGAAARLADLLRAVAAFATGGRKALAGQNTEAAKLLLSQMK
jgi:hypothetical protein